MRYYAFLLSHLWRYDIPDSFFLSFYPYSIIHFDITHTHRHNAISPDVLSGSFPPQKNRIFFHRFTIQTVPFLLSTHKITFHKIPYVDSSTVMHFFFVFPYSSPCLFSFSLLFTITFCLTLTVFK